MHRRQRVHRLAALCSALALASALCGAAGDPTATAQPAGGMRICDQFGSVTVADRYIVKSNRWGSRTAVQCIDVSADGFTVTEMSGTADRPSRPIGYPSIYYGCFFSVCTPSTQLPMPIDRIASAVTNARFSRLGAPGENAAYDIWLDSRPGVTTSQQQMELMISFSGSDVSALEKYRAGGNVTIGGHGWQVFSLGPWGHGGREVIYLSDPPMAEWQFDVMDFVRDLRARGLVDSSYMLTSVQAGLECWAPCQGAGLDSFRVDVSPQ